jgi:hypothetical protein
MRLSVALLMSTVALAATTGAAVPTASQPSSPPGKLGIWAGHWTYSGRIYATPYSDAHSDSGSMDCNWVPNSGYMVCDYSSNDPPHNHLSVITYDSVAKAYAQVLVVQDSKPSWRKITQSGGTWTMSSEISYKKKMLMSRDVFVFTSPNKRITRVQISANNGRSWTTMIEVTAVKIVS